MHSKLSITIALHPILYEIAIRMQHYTVDTVICCSTLLLLPPRIC